MANTEKVTIEGVEIFLSKPVQFRQDWIGQNEPMEQLLACWMTLSEDDKPLTPRIVGAPGLGKTTLAMAAARRRSQEVFVSQCTADTRPEDILITPVLAENGHIKYQASPLVSAMILGGIAVLDEGNRMSEKSWASLAPLLDDRRMVESIVAGVTITADKEFRCVTTMNEDNSTFEIPDYIMSRLQPAIELPFPNADEELSILKYNLPTAPQALLEICLGFLQKAHELDLPYSIRDGLNAIRYGQRLRKSKGDSGTWDEYFTKAIVQILGTEALNLEEFASKRQRQGLILPNMQLGDFFFDEDSPLNPDNR